MGLITSALQIGRSALLAYQGALHSIGNNISNAGSTRYTRQSPVLTPLPGVPLPEGMMPGAGVALTGLRRNIDEALEARLRAAIGDQRSVLVQQQVLGRIEALFNELTDNDLSTLLDNFFNAWSSLQNTPQDLASRGIILMEGTEVARALRLRRADLSATVEELNGQVVSLIERANEIVGELAGLNKHIVETEASAQGLAASLRDQRDGLLRDLSEIMEITVREQESGAINVYVGNDPLVQAGITRGLTAELETEDGIARAVVRFADDKALVRINGGELEGVITSRDQHVLGEIESLDRLAAALIHEVNKIHSEGQGLAGLTSVTGTYDLFDPTVALNTADNGLSLLPRNGSFVITVTDEATGVSLDTLIEVDLDGIGADTTLNSLAAAITANVANVTATVPATNQLKLTADSGFSFTFKQDSSDVLAALGINTFFNGDDALNIEINALVADSPALLAAAMEKLPGDGSNAGRLAAAATVVSSELDGMSIVDFYDRSVAELAVVSSAAAAGVEAADVIHAALTAQRESISGVSLDEEAVQLMKFERAFQGAARYVTVVDELIGEILNLVR